MSDIIRRDDSFALIGPAGDLADKIARTEFVPKGLRGRPEAVLACILAGHEVGIGPMTALQYIDVIDGRPAQRTQLMKMLVLSKGHRLWVEESTNTRAVVCGQRAGEERTHRVTYTLDDGQRAGLLGKDNWRKYPRQMVLARAWGDLARIAFADVLGGMPYLAEELEDGGVIDGMQPQSFLDGAAAPAPATHRRRRGRPSIAAPAAPVVGHADEGSFTPADPPPPKPAEPQNRIIREGQIPPRREEPPLEPPGPPPSVIEGQLKASLGAAQTPAPPPDQLFDQPFEDDGRRKATPKSRDKSPARPPAMLAPKSTPTSQPPVTEKQPGESLTLNQQIAMVCKEAGIERRDLIWEVTGKERGSDLTREEAGVVLERARELRRKNQPGKNRGEGFLERALVTGVKAVLEGGEQFYEVATEAGPFVTADSHVARRADEWKDLVTPMAVLFRVEHGRRVIVGLEPADAPAGEELEKRWQHGS